MDKEQRNRKILELYERGFHRLDLAIMYSLSPGQISRIILAERAQRRARGEEPPERTIVSGEEERLPPVEDTGDGFIVRGKGREVEISKNNLRKLKEFYCREKLTINATCRRLDIPRRDFMLIKNAFSITKDDVPYIDEDMRTRETDDLVAESLERAKDRYFIRLQEQEIKALKKEVAKYRSEEYALDRLDKHIAKHMRGFAQKYRGPGKKPTPKITPRQMLVVPIFDLHLGKLAWAPETGENYDYKICRERFLGLIARHIEQIAARRFKFEKIIYPIGNDFFNFDTIEQTTTAGTRQDSDLRWQKLAAVGEELLIRSIDMLAEIAPVEVFYVPGNHDKVSSLHAVRYLFAWYKDSDRVKIDPDPRARKYIEYGNNLIGFSHGADEKSRIYGSMQVEAPEAWGRTKYREFLCGHLHHEQTNEVHGVKVRRLPCLTGTDAWHYEKGYIGAIPMHISLIYHHELGPFGSMSFTLDNIMDNRGGKDDGGE